LVWQTEGELHLVTLCEGVLHLEGATPFG